MHLELEVNQVLDIASPQRPANSSQPASLPLLSRNVVVRVTLNCSTFGVCTPQMQKHLSEEAESQGHQQDLASAFPCTAAAAAAAASSTANKAVPRNALLLVAGAAEKGGSARLANRSKSVAGAPKSSNKLSETSAAARSAPPTPAVPPPTLPDEVPPAAEAAQGGPAAAAGMSLFALHAFLLTFQKPWTTLYAAAAGVFAGALFTQYFPASCAVAFYIATTCLPSPAVSNYKVPARRCSAFSKV